MINYAGKFQLSTRQYVESMKMREKSRESGLLSEEYGIQRCLYLVKLAGLAGQARRRDLHTAIVPCRLQNNLEDSTTLCGKRMVAIRIKMHLSIKILCLMCLSIFAGARTKLLRLR